MTDIHVHIHGLEESNVDSIKKSSRSKPSKRRSTPNKKPRKPSGWHKYMKNKRTQIKYKGGKNKGKLNLKAMGVQYRKKKR